MSLNWSTIRVWFLVINLLAAALIGTPAFAQGAATVRVDPTTSSIQVNDTANIAIKVDNITNLIAFELHLSFDSAVVEVTGITNGGFVPADFEAQKTFDNAAGTIDYAVAQMNRPPAQGSGTLLNIAVRAKAIGSSTVITRATPAAPSGFLLSDQNGMEISASWVPGTINVGTSTSATNTPTATSVTNIPTNTSTLTTTSTVTPCDNDDDDPCTPLTHTPTPTNTPTNTSTSTNTSISTSTSTNTPTITPTPTPPHPDRLGTHMVRWGEWLYCIGRAYRVSPWAIAKTNGIWWPNIIFPYQKLVIPNVPWTNIPAGPVCKAQFTLPATTPTPSPTPATPVTVTATATSTPVTATITPAPATTMPPSSCRAVYVVRQGDTLYRIGLRYGVSYIEIARVNGISNPRLIYPGQQLCIP